MALLGIMQKALNLNKHIHTQYKVHTNILKYAGKNKNALTFGNYGQRSAESCTYSEN